MKADIIRMAKQAGMEQDGDNFFSPNHEEMDVHIDDLKRLVEIARAEEREACAKVCENMTLEWEDQPSIAQAELATMMDCALAIRARGRE